MIRVTLIALLLLAAPARAELTGWTLALTWQPGFCTATPRSAQCGAKPTPRFVLHGLWTEGMGDEYCGISPDVRAVDRRRAWCDLPTPPLKRATSEALQKVMPGTTDCLERHEWTKHGVCASMDADSYWTATTDLAARVDRLPFAQALRKRATITAAELDAAMAQDLGSVGLRSVRAVCTKRGDDVHLVELRISLDAKNFRALPDTHAFLARDKWFDPPCPSDRPIILNAR